MSILDVETFPPRDPERIRLRSFARVRKGYDPDQVHEYLGRVAETVQKLLVEIDELRERAEVAGRAAEEGQTPAGEQAETKDPYAELAERMADVLRTAELHAEQVLTEAKDQSQTMLNDARKEAALVRQEAQQEADVARERAEEDAESIRASAAEALESARAETERILTGLTQRRHHLVSELHSTRERLVTIVEQLEQAVEEDAPTSGALLLEADDLPPAPASPLQTDAPASDELAGAWPEPPEGPDPRIIWQRDPFAPAEGPERPEGEDDPQQGMPPNGRAQDDQPPSHPAGRLDPDEHHIDELLRGTGTINLILPDIPSFEDDPGEGRQ